MSEDQTFNPKGEQPPISDSEIRYLAFAVISELHRQRELLATIAMYVAPDPQKAQAIQELIDSQQEGDYQVPMSWFD